MTVYDYAIAFFQDGRSPETATSLLIATSKDAPAAIKAEVERAWNDFSQPKIAEPESETEKTPDPDSKPDPVVSFELVLDAPSVAATQFDPLFSPDIEAKTVPATAVASLDVAPDPNRFQIMDELIALLESGKSDELKPTLARYGFTGSEADDFANEARDERAYRQDQREDDLVKFAADCKEQADEDFLRRFTLENNKRMPHTPEDLARWAAILKERERKAAEPEPELEMQEETLPDFPRLTGSLAELSDALYPNIPRDFKLMAAVTHWGLMRSGLDTLENESHLQPRFYTCFIKEAGWGKSAAISEIRKFMQIVSDGYCVTSSVDSGPALVDEFSEVTAKLPPMMENKSARLLLDPDEMRDLFEKAKVSPQSRNSLFTEMLKLYEDNRTGNRSRKSGKSQLKNAHLAIIGGATPDGFATMWTGTGGGSGGLQSRFVLVTTNAPRMPIDRAVSNLEAVSAAVERLRKQAEQPGQSIQITEEASRMLRFWWAGSARDKASETRADDMAKRLAIVLAVTNDTTTVGPDLMAQAIQFGDYVIAVRERFNPADSYSWTQAFEGMILAAAQKQQTGMTFRDFQRVIHPARKPGGLGPFKMAWQNVLATGMLKPDSKTVQGTSRYTLS